MRGLVPADIVVRFPSRPAESAERNFGGLVGVFQRPLQ